MKTWELLVPTFMARTPVFEGLLEQLDAQIRPGVSVIACRDNREMQIGDKRQRLLEAASADYICQVDDDAKLHPQYVALIHEAMQADPDVVGFLFRCVDAEGNFAGPLKPHSITFAKVPELLWPNRDDLYWGAHHCDLGTWMPVRRSIAQRVRYSGHLSEDDRWTRGVLATGLLKRELYIDELLVMPQILDQGFEGDWQPVEPTPHPERDWLRYV